MRMSMPLAGIDWITGLAEMAKEVRPDSQRLGRFGYMGKTYISDARIGVRLDRSSQYDSDASVERAYAAGTLDAYLNITRMMEWNPWPVERCDSAPIVCEYCCDETTWCSVCWGARAYPRETAEPINWARIAPGYFMLISTFPEVALFEHPESPYYPVCFGFRGGVGAVMPMRPRIEASWGNVVGGASRSDGGYGEEGGSRTAPTTGRMS